MVDDYMFNITSNSDIRLENQTYSDANHFRDYSENPNNKTAIYNMLSSMHTMSLEQLRSIKFLQIGQKSDTVMTDKVTDFLTFKAHHNEIDLDTQFIIEVKRDVDVVTRSGASNENLNKNTYTGFKGGKYYPEIELRFIKNQQTGLYELKKDGVVMFGVYETTNEKDGINWVWPPELKYYSFITQENINGNPSNRNLPFIPMNWETQNFNTRTNILHKIHKYKENRNLIETEEMNMIYIPYTQTTSTQGIYNDYQSIDPTQFFENPVLSSEREFSLEEIRSFRFFQFGYEDEDKNTYYNHIKLRRTEHSEDEITIETINENGLNEIPTIDGRFNNRNGGTMDAKQPFVFMILFEKQPNGKYKINDDIKQIESSSEDFNNKLRDDDRINRMSMFNYFTIITQSDVDTDPGITINGTTTSRSRNLNQPSSSPSSFPRNEDITFNTSDWTIRNQTLRRYVRNTSGYNEYETFIEKTLNNYNIVNPASSYSLEELKSFTQIVFKTNESQDDIDYERTKTLNHVQNTNIYTISLLQETNNNKVSYNKDDFIVEFDLKFSKRSDNRWELTHRTLNIRNDDQRFTNTNKPQHRNFKITEIELSQGFGGSDSGDNWFDSI